MSEKRLLIEIGQRLREARNAQKMSQADLAFYSDLSIPYISDIENGKRQLSVLTFCKIIDALKISADSILRPNTPQVNAMYQKEFASLFSDCTPSELESILKIIKEVKSTLHSQTD